MASERQFKPAAVTDVRHGTEAQPRKKRTFYLRRRLGLPCRPRGPSRLSREEPDPAMCGHNESPIDRAFQLLPSDMITTAEAGGYGVPTPRTRDAARMLSR
jgi:hypothetical protein